jgi:hypothetical protein
MRYFMAQFRLFALLIAVLITAALAAPASRCSAQEPPAKTPPPSTADGKKMTVKPDEIDELAIKTDRVTLNNFTLAERGDALYGVRNKKLTMLELSWSVKNRTEVASGLCLMAIGLDEKGEPLWALTTTFSADPKRTEAASAQGYVPAGILKKTATIRVVVEGDL